MTINARSPCISWSWNVFHCRHIVSVNKYGYAEHSFCVIGTNPGECLLNSELVSLV